MICVPSTSGPVSAQLLVNAETVAVGVTIAVLVFPLQCLLCFLFRKAHSQVTQQFFKWIYFLDTFYW